jgi:DNA-binding PadR family transcriptional regulator
LLAERRVNDLPPINLTDGASCGKFTGILELWDRFPREPLEFFDRALVNLGKLTGHPVGFVTITEHLPAVCFAHTIHEALEMLHQMTVEGWISPRDPTNPTRTVYTVTPAGWRRIEKLRAPGRDSRQAFVAMWFDPSRTVFFDNGFKPAIEDDKITIARRIDRVEHNRKIDDEIIANIRRSRYLVADVTGFREGVYYEAGFALGLGLPVIWCIEKGGESELHFDTRQYNHIVYDNPGDLKTKLLNRIRATIV